MAKKKKEWIKFELIIKKPKTKVYHVITTYDDAKIIGEISWYCPWRCYVFYPAPSTVWEPNCLNQIIKFIDSLMEERKNIRRL